MPNHHWSCIQIQHGLHLSMHADLPLSSVTKKALTVTLIGHAINPYQPQANESDILHSLLAKGTEFHVFIESTKPLIGRWVIIFQNHKATYIFTDPCGFRQVFYHSDGKDCWCGSQPELIKVNCDLRLNTNPMLISFLTHRSHVLLESPWVGNSTLYKKCFHLLPNHYLNLNSTDQVRFYPGNVISRQTTSEIIESASTILQGAMLGISNRYKVSLALTAGMDSRILLAASKHISNDIDYFVYREDTFGANHPDIWVPKKMAKKLDIRFTVKTPSNSLPGWFVSILSQNVTCARFLSKTYNIYDKLVTGNNKININGNASEICRNFFDPYCRVDVKRVSTPDLAAQLLGQNLSAQLLGQETIPSFVKKEIDEWRNTLESLSLNEDLNILDFLYWEQRLGNWGA